MNVSIGSTSVRFTLYTLVILSAVAALNCEGDEIIVQRSLQAALAPLRLALNQPLQAWIKLLGSARRVDAEDDDFIAFAFNAGRFVVVVELTGTSRLGTSVAIRAKDGKPELPTSGGGDRSYWIPWA